MFAKKGFAITSTILLAAGLLWHYQAAYAIDRCSALFVVHHEVGLHRKAIIRDLLPPTNQCSFGTCGFHAYVRALEYAYRALTGNKIEIGTVWYEAAATILKAKYALDNKNIPLTDIIPASRDWSFKRAIEYHFGMVLKTDDFKKNSLWPLAEEARAIVWKTRRMVAKTESSSQHTGDKLKQIQGYLREANESLTSLAEKFGLFLEGAVDQDGRKVNPRATALASEVRKKIDWVRVGIPDAKITISRHSTVEQINTYDEVNAFYNHDQPWLTPEFLVEKWSSFKKMITALLTKGYPVRIDVQDFILTEENYLVPSSDEVRNNHALVLVGVETDSAGKSTFILQNSWGSTTSNPLGLVYCTEANFYKLVTQIEFPVLLP